MLGIIPLCLMLLFAPAEELRLPVTRDTWVSGVGSETAGNNGGAPKLKLKSYQEFSLIDIDPKPLRGKVVEKATLHLFVSGPEPIRRVTVGSVGASWVEGSGRSYEIQKGSSSYSHRVTPDVPWTLDGGDITRVILGQGGTTWAMSEASKPDGRGFVSIAVDPKIVALRAAGLSEGFVVFDDTGSEWVREGEKFTAHHMPNRYVSSKDQNSKEAPYFTIVLGAADRQAPGPVADLESSDKDLPSGEASVSWRTPTDQRIAGFKIKTDNYDIPRYMIPLADTNDNRLTMHLRDLPLKPGRTVKLKIRAVDFAGNEGPDASIDVRLAEETVLPVFELPKTGSAGNPATAKPPMISIVDELDKIQPITGQMIPDHDLAYLRKNHLWDSSKNLISLQGSRNEFIAFQVVVPNDGKSLKAELIFDQLKNNVISTEIGEYVGVATKLGPLPDPIVPIKDSIADKAAKTRSLHVETYIGHQAQSGKHDGVLKLTLGNEVSTINVSLTVLAFTLPDTLSFLPEMNCYGLPKNELAYYRLAHKHRTVLNRVPYSQRGIVEEGCAPKWDGKSFDFTEWDSRFGPLLDGSAFRDLPRSGVPIECFYLPLHENWPTPIETSYNGSYWADHAFTPEYRRAFVEANRLFADHIQASKWSGTLFHVFFNGKNDFKKNGWSRGSSPWLLDEPANFQDFWALRYFGIAAHEGIHQSKGDAKMLFRCDISRPEWQRDSLEGLLDYNVVGGGAFRKYLRTVLDRKAAEGQIVVEYGSANAIEESNMQAVGWSLDSWSLGSDGVLPWQVIGRRESWDKADVLSLFYPSKSGGDPIPSVRLKAFRRGQQDAEYLTLLQMSKNQPRWAIGSQVRKALRLSGERGASNPAAIEDAGVIRYNDLTPEQAWGLRTRVGNELSLLSPVPKARLIELSIPKRDPSQFRSKEIIDQSTKN